VNRSKRLSRLKAAESIAYLKVFSAIPAACPQLPFFTYISPDCLRTLILPLTFVGCIYSSFSLSFGIHTEVFYIVVNVKHWESPGKDGGLPFKSSVENPSYDDFKMIRNGLVENKNTTFGSARISVADRFRALGEGAGVRKHRALGGHKR